MEPVLATALDLLQNDRSRQHGPATLTFATIARLWSAYLTTVIGSEVTILPEQAAVMMALFKISRTEHGCFNRDDYVDGAAYLQIAHDCHVASVSPETMV